MSLGEPGDQVGLVGDGVKNVPDEEFASAGLMPAEAADMSRSGGLRKADDLRGVAFGADQRPVGDHLDAVARDLPLVADVGGAHLVLAGKRLALERIEV